MTYQATIDYLYNLLSELAENAIDNLDIKDELYSRLSKIPELALIMQHPNTRSLFYFNAPDDHQRIVSLISSAIDILEAN